MMYWFRSNRCTGTRLALLALAVQLVLSFGHVHYYGFAAAKATPAATENESDTAAASKLAPFHKSDGSGGFDCSICVLIQLSAGAAPAAVPALPLAGVSASGIPISIASISAASPHSPFQARAPPSS
jgi:hypothetical protein